jgi:hypothetical protein
VELVVRERREAAETVNGRGANERPALKALTALREG